MDITHVTLLVLVGFGAAFVQRVTGFGLGIFAMIFLPFFMSTHTAAAAVSCFLSCSTTIYNSVKYRRDIPVKAVLPLIFAALITIPVAVYFSVMVSNDIFSVILGFVLVLLSIYFLFFSKKISLKPSFTAGFISGSLAGILNGLFSTGGPPIVLYLSNAFKDKIIYFAAIQFYFAVTNIYATIMRIANGVVDNQVLSASIIGICGCIIGDFFGKIVFDKLNADIIKKLIYVCMIVSGVIMIF